MRLSVPGRHMALNALGALLAAVEAGAPADAVLDGLAGFEGVRRRFELVGTATVSRVFDDYAHHPTEVAATLDRAARRRRAGRARPRHRGLSAAFVFAHRGFRREFGQALDAADEVFVLDVYAAREQPIAGVSGAIVADAVTAPVHLRARTSRRSPTRVAAVAGPGDVVVTMGAGDVTMLGAGDSGRAAGQGQPQRPRRAGDGAEMTEPGRTIRQSAPRSRRRHLDCTRCGRTGRREAAEPEEAADEPTAADRARGHGAGRGGNVRSAGPPRRGPPPSRTPAATPSGVRWADRSARRKRSVAARSAGLKVLMWSAADRGPRRGPRVCCCTSRRSCRRAASSSPVWAQSPRTRWSPRRRWRRGRHCCRSTPMRWPNGWRRSGASPPPACSASIRPRCGSRSSSGCRSWSGIIRTGRTCSTATAWISPSRRRRRVCRTSTPRTRAPSDPATKAALQVMTSLRPEVAGQVGRVAAPSVAAITLTLIDGRVVVWGTTDRTEEKALKLGRAAHPAGPDLRRLQPGPADGQVEGARSIALRRRLRSMP